jgi:hypothetical protein
MPQKVVEYVQEGCSYYQRYLDGWRRKEAGLPSAVETYDGRAWAEIAMMFPGRNESQWYRKQQRMSEENAEAESVPKTDAALLASVAGMEVGPDLHVFPRDTQKFLALLGITTAGELCWIFGS